MRESRADTVVALTGALLLHALLALLVVFGLWWTRPPLSAAGEPMSADLVDASALSAAARRALARPPRPQPEQESTPPPQPLPSPVPEDAQVERQQKAQERIPQPDTREQEKVDRNAESPETAQREQEEKRRQEQIDLTERQRQLEAEQKRRMAQQQLERDKQLADIRKERAKAAREAQLAEARLKQLADFRARNAAAAASTSAPPGNRGVDSALAGRYIAAIAAAVTSNWIRPDSVPLGQRCRLTIKQLPGGEVVDVEIDPSCPYDEAGRRSIEAAILKSSPLPYAGFESVFQRTLPFNFTGEEQ